MQRKRVWWNGWYVTFGDVITRRPIHVYKVAIYRQSSHSNVIDVAMYMIIITMAS